MSSEAFRKSKKEPGRRAPGLARIFLKSMKELGRNKPATASKKDADEVVETEQNDSKTHVSTKSEAVEKSSVSEKENVTASQNIGKLTTHGLATDKLVSDKEIPSSKRKDSNGNFCTSCTQVNGITHFGDEDTNNNAICQSPEQEAVLYSSDQVSLCTKSDECSNSDIPSDKGCSPRHKSLQDEVVESENRCSVVTKARKHSTLAENIYREKDVTLHRHRSKRYSQRRHASESKERGMERPASENWSTELTQVENKDENVIVPKPKSNATSGTLDFETLTVKSDSYEEDHTDKVEITSMYKGNGAEDVVALAEDPSVGIFTNVNESSPDDQVDCTCSSKKERNMESVTLDAEHIVPEIDLKDWDKVFMQKGCSVDLENGRPVACDEGKKKENEYEIQVQENIGTVSSLLGKEKNTCTKSPDTSEINEVANNLKEQELESSLIKQDRNGQDVQAFHCNPDLIADGKCGQGDGIKTPPLRIPVCEIPAYYNRLRLAGTSSDLNHKESSSSTEKFSNEYHISRDENQDRSPASVVRFHRKCQEWQSYSSASSDSSCQVQRTRVKKPKRMTRSRSKLVRGHRVTVSPVQRASICPKEMKGRSSKEGRPIRSDTKSAYDGLIHSKVEAITVEMKTTNKYEQNRGEGLLAAKPVMYRDSLRAMKQGIVPPRKRTGTESKRYVCQRSDGFNESMMIKRQVSSEPIKQEHERQDVFQTQHQSSSTYMIIRQVSSEPGHQESLEYRDYNSSDQGSVRNESDGRRKSEQRHHSSYKYQHQCNPDRHLDVSGPKTCDSTDTESGCQDGQDASERVDSKSVRQIEDSKKDMLQSRLYGSELACCESEVKKRQFKSEPITGSGHLCSEPSRQPSEPRIQYSSGPEDYKSPEPRIQDDSSRKTPEISGPQYDKYSEPRMQESSGPQDHKRSDATMQESLRPNVCRHSQSRISGSSEHKDQKHSEPRIQENLRTPDQEHSGPRIQDNSGAQDHRYSELRMQENSGPLNYRCSNPRIQEILGPQDHTYSDLRIQEESGSHFHEYPEPILQDKLAPQYQTNSKPRMQENSGPCDHKHSETRIQENSGPQDHKHSDPRMQANSGPRSRDHKHSDPGMQEYPEPQERRHSDSRMQENSGPRDYKHSQPRTRENLGPQDHKHSESRIQEYSRPRERRYFEYRIQENAGPQGHQHIDPRILENSGPQDHQHSDPRIQEYSRLQECRYSEHRIQENSGHRGHQHTDPRMQEHSGPQYHQHSDARIQEYSGPREGRHSESRMQENSGPRDYKHSEPRMQENSGPRDYKHSEPRMQENSGPRGHQHTDTRMQENLGPQCHQHTDPRMQVNSGPRERRFSESKMQENAEPHDYKLSEPRMQEISISRDHKDSDSRIKENSGHGDHERPEPTIQENPGPQDHKYSAPKNSGLQYFRYSDPRIQKNSGPRHLAYSEPRRQENSGPRDFRCSGRRIHENSGPRDFAYSEPSRPENAGTKDHKHSEPKINQNPGPEAQKHSVPNLQRNSGFRHDKYSEPRIQDNSEPQDHKHSGPRMQENSGPRDYKHSELRTQENSGPRDHKGSESRRMQESLEPENRKHSEPRIQENSGPRDHKHSEPRIQEKSGHKDYKHSGPKIQENSGSQDHNHPELRIQGNSGPQNRKHSEPMIQEKSGSQDHNHPEPRIQENSGPHDHKHSEPRIQESLGPQNRKHPEPRTQENAGPQNHKHSEPRIQKSLGPQNHNHPEPRIQENSGPQNQNHSEPRIQEKSGPQDHKHSDSRIQESLGRQNHKHTEPRTQENSGPQNHNHSEPRIQESLGPQNHNHPEPRIQENSGPRGHQHLDPKIQENSGTQLRDYKHSESRQDKSGPQSQQENSGSRDYKYSEFSRQENSGPRGCTHAEPRTQHNLGFYGHTHSVTGSQDNSASRCHNHLETRRQDILMSKGVYVPQSVGRIPSETSWRNCVKHKVGDNKPCIVSELENWDAELLVVPVVSSVEECDRETPAQSMSQPQDDVLRVESNRLLENNSNCATKSPNKNATIEKDLKCKDVMEQRRTVTSMTSDGPSILNKLSEENIMDQSKQKSSSKLGKDFTSSGMTDVKQYTDSSTQQVTSELQDEAETQACDQSPNPLRAVPDPPCSTTSPIHLNKGKSSSSHCENLRRYGNLQGDRDEKGLPVKKESSIGHDPSRDGKDNSDIDLESSGKYVKTGVTKSSLGPTTHKMFENPWISHQRGRHEQRKHSNFDSARMYSPKRRNDKISLSVGHQPPVVGKPSLSQLEENWDTHLLDIESILDCCERKESLEQVVPIDQSLKSIKEICPAELSVGLGLQSRHQLEEWDTTLLDFNSSKIAMMEKVMKKRESTIEVDIGMDDTENSENPVVTGDHIELPLSSTVTGDPVSSDPSYSAGVSSAPVSSAPMPLSPVSSTLLISAPFSSALVQDEMYIGDEEDSIIPQSESSLGETTALSEFEDFGTSDDVLESYVFLSQEESCATRYSQDTDAEQFSTAASTDQEMELADNRQLHFPSTSKPQSQAHTALSGKPLQHRERQADFDHENDRFVENDSRDRKRNPPGYGPSRCACPASGVQFWTWRCCSCPWGWEPRVCDIRSGLDYPSEDKDFNDNPVRMRYSPRGILAMGHTMIPPPPSKELWNQMQQNASLRPATSGEGTGTRPAVDASTTGIPLPRMRYPGSYPFYPGYSSPPPPIPGCSFRHRSPYRLHYSSPPPHSNMNTPPRPSTLLHNRSPPPPSHLPIRTTHSPSLVHNRTPSAELNSIPGTPKYTWGLANVPFVPKDHCKQDKKTTSVESCSSKGDEKGTSRTKGEIVSSSEMEDLQLNSPKLVDYGPSETEDSEEEKKGQQKLSKAALFVKDDHSQDSDCSSEKRKLEEGEIEDDEDCSNLSKRMHTMSKDNIYHFIRHSIKCDDQQTMEDKKVTAYVPPHRRQRISLTDSSETVESKACVDKRKLTISKQTPVEKDEDATVPASKQCESDLKPSPGSYPWTPFWASPQPMSMPMSPLLGYHQPHCMYPSPYYYSPPDWFHGCTDAYSGSYSQNHSSHTADVAKATSPTSRYRSKENIPELMTCPTETPERLVLPPRIRFMQRTRLLGDIDSESTGSSSLSRYDWKASFKEKCKRYCGTFIDSHCHLDILFNRHEFKGTWSKFKLLNEATMPDNFEGCVAVFCYPGSFRQEGLWKEVALEDDVWMAFGCHPKHATEFTPRAEEGLIRCLQHKKVVALGEIGLDYSGIFRQHEAIQKIVFVKQIQIALEMNKPLVIHCREAEEDALQILEKTVPRNYRIHCHCFTGDYESAKKWFTLFPNLYIGLTPLVSYRTATPTHEVARFIPLERLLLETDAPYFIPRKFPKDEVQYSHPGMAITVAEHVAYLKRCSVTEVLHASRQNTRTMYGI